jgi:uncharacterized membrane protein (UPF0182 family)
MARPDVIDMDDYSPRRPVKTGGGGIGLGGWLLILFVFIASARTIAKTWIDFAWWKEMGQVETWGQMLLYGWLPSLAAGLLAFPILWGLYSRAHRGRFRAWTMGVGLFVSLILGAMLIDNWTVVRYYGSTAATADAWRDPVFGKPIGFYFFQLPFYEMLLRYVQGILVVGFVVYWVASRFESLRDGFSRMQVEEGVDLRSLNLGDSLRGPAVRIAAGLFFLLLAGRAYLSRFDVLFEDHGFLVGADYVDVNIVLPMIWGLVGACVAGAGLVMAGRAGIAVALVVLVYIASGIIPRAVNAISVRPNEISLQKPYIERHIEGTRTAFGLASELKERDFPAKISGTFEPAKHQALLDNVRLWDWKAFHDTITQIQALRPYYVFADTDVDRYTMADGQVRQVLLSPRELDVRQLPDARSRWINPHFIYTHGYGMVIAEANRITKDGLPELLVKDAPLVVREGAPKVTRPELYYGEAVHEPVFVRTAQPEFNYPSGNENVHSKYSGAGGIPIDGLLMRFAAAVAEGDWNILLTSYLTPESRMLIHRKVAARVDKLAEFVVWDGDPYMVVTKEGKMVWMIDGYTVHSMHPYSRSVATGFGEVNYMRNSVKATVDAYDGSTVLYAWDEADPVLASYRTIFPKLFRPKTEMPADLREHARYPETLFRVQAEMYRTYHMKNPEAFYNREDPWDLAKTSDGMDGQADEVKPTYLMATLPGETKPEFMLLTTFTPRNKQNLIGLMAARCDGTRLGELEVLRLSKQELIYGPMQIAARINQDQAISKDLTLWNQQGSKVIKGQMLVLPMGEQFLYVEPIYIQSANAPMPELKKVAVGLGSLIGYGNTYAEALSQLGAGIVETSVTLAQPPVNAASSTPGVVTPPKSATDPRIEKVRLRLRHYKELMGQGKYVDAARELEAIESEIKQ